MGTNGRNLLTLLIVKMCVYHAGATGGEGECVDDQLSLPIPLHVHSYQLVLRKHLLALSWDPESTCAALLTLLGVAHGDPHNLPNLLHPEYQPVHDELLLVVKVRCYPGCYHLLCAGARFCTFPETLSGSDDVVTCHLVGKDWLQILLPLQSLLDKLSWVALRPITE